MTLVCAFIVAAFIALAYMDGDKKTITEYVLVADEAISRKNTKILGFIILAFVLISSLLLIIKNTNQL